MGKIDGKRSHTNRRISSDPILAHPPGPPAQSLHVPSAHVRRGDPLAEPRCLGPFLCPSFHLEAFKLCQVSTQPPCVRFHLKPLPSNARQSRNRRRQRAPQPPKCRGAVPGETL